MIEMTHLRKICRGCGQEFLAPRIQAFVNGKPNGWKCRAEYCSNSCRNKRFSELASNAVHKKADPNTVCCICNAPLYRAPRSIKRNKHGKFTCGNPECRRSLKAQEMKGNQRGRGIKQTPERIAHRVSFVKGEKNACWNGGVSFCKTKGLVYRLIKCPEGY